MFELVVTKVAIVHPKSCEVFYSLRIVALKNTIWSRFDEFKDALLKLVKIC